MARLSSILWGIAFFVGSTSHCPGMKFMYLYGFVVALPGVNIKGWLGHGIAFTAATTALAWDVCQMGILIRVKVIQAVSVVRKRPRVSRCLRSTTSLFRRPDSQNSNSSGGVASKLAGYMVHVHSFSTCNVRRTACAAPA